MTAGSSQAAYEGLQAVHLEALRLQSLGRLPRVGDEFWQRYGRALTTAERAAVEAVVTLPWGMRDLLAEAHHLFCHEVVDVLDAGPFDWLLGRPEATD